MEIHLPDQTFTFEGFDPIPVSVPEFRFRNDDVTEDPTKCGSPFNIDDVWLEDDDLFSMYIDLEKLEEQEVNAGHDDNFHENGGGFVVESSDDAGGRGRRRRKKDDKKVKYQTRKTQKCCREKSCSVDDTVLEPRKAILAEDLAQLWITNPKRAQRIMSNRQSAARSKEKKARYKLDLEKKVMTLHSKTLELNSELDQNQKEITDLAAKKSELILQLQTMEQQVKLYDSQTEELQQEIERLKTAIGERDYSDWLNMQMNQLSDYSHLALLPQIHSFQLSM